MEIVFLGTGGGRINLIKQVRGTGGFRINSKSANIHVDPGPGALIYSIKNGQDPLSLDAIIVTHNHTDHVSDAAVMIEGMTSYSLKKRGIVIGSKKTLEGEEKGIGNWHQSLVTTYTAQYGDSKHFKTAKGEFGIEIAKMKHDEPTTFGFRLTMDGRIIGYITDTEYIESLVELTDCDLLIVNCIKPQSDGYHGHLTSEDVIKILRTAKPKKCVITHLGLKMLAKGPNEEADRITKESGIGTIAAKDGMKITL